MENYYKLVRDKIPEIIKADNKRCEIEIVDDKKKYELLKNKLEEEVNEFLTDENLEELADVLEVLVGLANSLGYTEEELMKKRIQKIQERGGFNKGVVLKKVF